MGKETRMADKALLVIGVGNVWRGDDAVGLAVLEHLRAALPEVPMSAASGEGAALMESWAAVRHVIIIDATASGAAPGTIHRLDAQAQPIPAELFHYSTHDFGVAEAIEMARVLGRLPESLIIYGIEGSTFDFGAELAPAVARAVPDVVQRIHQEIVQLRSRA
jgi:hydrogenase maturation protease